MMTHSLRGKASSMEHSASLTSKSRRSRSCAKRTTLNWACHCAERKCCISVIAHTLICTIIRIRPMQAWTYFVNVAACKVTGVEPRATAVFTGKLVAIYWEGDCLCLDDWVK